MKRGFTLIELVIVIVIIGILAAIGIPQYLSAVQSGYRAEAVGTIGEIRRMELAYYGVYNIYDTSLPDGINIDIENDGATDISMGAPSSARFTYTYNATGAGAGNATIDAARVVGAGSANSYRMRLDNGSVSTF